MANLSTKPIEQHQMDDAPSAPEIEVTDSDNFVIKWTHTVGSNDNLGQAFDILYRVGDNALWREACVTTVFGDRGDRTLRVGIIASTSIPTGEVVQARYRKRSGAFCVSGLSYSWSSVGETTVSGDDHGDSFASATVVNVPSDTEGDIEEAGDLDYFSLNITSRGTLTVETSGSTDTRGRLFDGNEDELDSDDDGGGGTNFKIERIVDTGTYYIEVKGFSANTTGAYTLRVRFEEEDSSGSGAPDLAWDEPAKDSLSASAGGSVDVVLIVRNQGDADAPSTRLRFYESTNSTISRSDIELLVSAESTGVLEPGDGIRWTVRVRMPSSAEIGEVRYYGACADTVANESDTTNNCSESVRVTVSDSGG